tara:strand:- start:657 stop:974 length:318 start_codon:yes stop_codon:yes gene_type:complete
MSFEKKYPSRYDYGVKKVLHKGVEITTSLNTNIERLLDKIPQDIEYEVATCLPFAAHRPDSISDIFYSNPSLWWYIMLFNNINDPFEGFNPGDRILIPNENKFKF